MSRLRNVAGSENASSIPMADSYLRVAHEIHVLLVDHEPEALLNTAKMLELCGYRVTCVDVASRAIATLMRSNVRVDLIMANVNSPDNQSYKLLEISVTNNIPVILLSFDDNIFTTARAVESGALLCLQKPIPIGMLKYLWQLAMRERMRKPVRDHQRGLLSEPTRNNNCNNIFQQDVEIVDGGLRLGAIVGGNANVNNGLELGAIGCNNVGAGIEDCMVTNELGLGHVVGSNNVDNGLEFGATGGTYVNNGNAGFGANNVNNGLEFRAVGGGSNVNGGLELGALRGGTVKNRLEVGAVGRGNYVNNGPGFSGAGGFMVNNGLEPRVGNNVNNGLNGSKYNGLEHGAIGGCYVNNGLGLGNFGGSNNNVNGGLGLGAFGGRMQVNNGLVAKTANNNGKEMLQIISDDDSDEEEEVCWEEYRKGKKKVVEWTEELHARFVYAVRKLGRGRCFPKAIKKLMNVPGLTRLQVASHLQKCRNGNWRSPEERKNQLRIQSDSASKSPPRSNNPTKARFGSMPELITKTTSESSCPSQSNESCHAGPLQNMMFAGSSSGPVNMAVVANDGGGAGDARNCGPPMIPCHIPEMNAINHSASAGVGTHHQIPSNPNFFDLDEDFFDDFQTLMQNISDPMPQANQNANYPGNQLSGSEPNVMDR